MAQANSGPRAILRVFEVLAGIAGNPDGKTFAALREGLSLPKSSLHRFLRTLEAEGYVNNRSGTYTLGPASRLLADLIRHAMPVEEFPASIQSIMNWLARDSGETVFLGELTEDQSEVVYIIVVNSTAALRFTIPVGVRRPLYSVASGKAILAYSPSELLQSYLKETKFERLTKYTSRKREMAAIIEQVRKTAVAYDRDGSIIGASGVASPVFNKYGKLTYSVSIAGPTERIQRDRKRLDNLVREGGERLSRLLGYVGPYPPAT
jgi:DNA-binding IclR family transcriptional regulator